MALDGWAIVLLIIYSLFLLNAIWAAFSDREHKKVGFVRTNGHIMNCFYGFSMVAHMGIVLSSGTKVGAPGVHVVSEVLLSAATWCFVAFLQMFVYGCGIEPLTQPPTTPTSLTATHHDHDQHLLPPNRTLKLVCSILAIKDGPIGLVKMVFTVGIVLLVLIDVGTLVATVVLLDPPYPTHPPTHTDTPTHIHTTTIQAEPKNTPQLRRRTPWPTERRQVFSI